MDAATLSRAAGISLPRAGLWAPLLTAAMDRYGITTRPRQAAFIAQTAHESMGFSRLREMWGPTAAQRGYEGRADLGNTQPGDGKRFMGRGLIQITGRANYTKVAKALGVDVVKTPTLLEQEQYAAMASAWWWQDRGLNQLADAGDFLGLSVRINGKNKTTGLPNGWDDRLDRWQTAKAALGVT